MYHTFDDQGTTYFVHAIASFEFDEQVGPDEDRVDHGDSPDIVDDSTLHLGMADGSKVTLSGSRASSLYHQLRELSKSLLEDE